LGQQQQKLGGVSTPEVIKPHEESANLKVKLYFRVMQRLQNGIKGQRFAKNSQFYWTRSKLLFTKCWTADMVISKQCVNCRFHWYTKHHCSLTAFFS